MSKKNICVIGSGPCGITTCQELLKYNYDVTLVDIDTNLEKIKNLFPHSPLQKKENISPKYNNSKFNRTGKEFHTGLHEEFGGRLGHAEELCGFDGSVCSHDHVHARHRHRQDGVDRRTHPIQGEPGISGRAI